MNFGDINRWMIACWINSWLESPLDEPMKLTDEVDVICVRISEGRGSPKSQTDKNQSKIKE